MAHSWLKRTFERDTAFENVEHNPPHVMIWAGMTSDYLIGPYFFDGPVNAAGRIMSMKISSDIIGYRSRELPVCSAVPQPLHHRAPHCV
jgi:hypothetical protein